MNSSTYLNGHGAGWPQSHSVDDTYECPPHTWVAPASAPTEREYLARFSPSGGAELVIKTTDTKYTVIANFDTHADAVIAAEALNNHKGY